MCWDEVSWSEMKWGSVCVEMKWVSACVEMKQRFAMCWDEVRFGYVEMKRTIQLPSCYSLLDLKKEPLRSEGRMIAEFSEENTGTKGARGHGLTLVTQRADTGSGPKYPDLWTLNCCYLYKPFPHLSNSDTTSSSFSVTCFLSLFLACYWGLKVYNWFSLCRPTAGIFPAE